jgi:hypothetical protein
LDFEDTHLPKNVRLVVVRAVLVRERFCAHVRPFLLALLGTVGRVVLVLFGLVRALRLPGDALAERVSQVLVRSVLLVEGVDTKGRTLSLADLRRVRTGAL